MSRRRSTRRRPMLDSPLARWAFIPPGALAFHYGYFWPAVLCTAVTVLAWRVRRPRRRRQ